MVLRPTPFLGDDKATHVSPALTEIDFILILTLANFAFADVLAVGDRRNSLAFLQSYYSIARVLRAE